MGGGSGGGGGSGRVSHPEYLETIHKDWLNNTGDDTIAASESMTALMDIAIDSGSPFATATAFDPATPLADAWTAVCAFNTVADALANETDWLSAIAAARSEYDDNVVDSTQIDDDVNAMAQQLEDQLTNITIPKLKAGYRDANAVNSSAYPIAEAVVRGMGMRDVAKYATDLRLKNHFLRAEWIGRAADTMLSNLMQRVQFEQAVAQMSIEAKRIHIVATKEQTDQDYAFDEADGRWDLEVYQYGANLLAAIGGGTSMPGKERPSKSQSALGGALSGFAAGMAVPGGGFVTGAIGGLLGLGASFL